MEDKDIGLACDRAGCFVWNLGSLEMQDIRHAVPKWTLVIVLLDPDNSQLGTVSRARSKEHLQPHLWQL